MPHGSPQRRSGLTLLELMVAMTVTVMVIGTLGGLARTVQQGFEYSQGYGTASQHARVVLDRITQNVCQATANDQFPGCLAVAEQSGSYRYPDTLVIWRPSGMAGNLKGLPRYSELLIYCPHPSVPNQFVEMTAPNDTRTVPAAEDETAWQGALAELKKAADTKLVVLTDLLRTCSTSTTGDGNWRGAVRFETRQRPSTADWNSYKAGTTDWANLPWAQGIYGATTGLRQVWLRMEVQLMPGEDWVASDPGGAKAIPYLGSAALYYQLQHP